MRDFSIDLIWAKVQMAAAAVGGWLGYFLGGLDGLLIALVVFMVLDYITGIMCAIADKQLSSEVGFRGICKKVLILMLVGVANIVDVHVVGTGSALRGRASRPAGSRKAQGHPRSTAQSRGQGKHDRPERRRMSRRSSLWRKDNGS